MQSESGLMPGEGLPADVLDGRADWAVVEGQGEAAPEHRGLPDFTRLEIRQAHVVSRVRAGARVADAAREVHMSVKSVQHWRERTPGFAERLDQARRDARAMAIQCDQHRFLALVQGGMSGSAALKRMGIGTSQASNWLRRSDPRSTYAREYRRTFGPTGRMGTATKHTRLFDELARGASIPGAARVAGVEKSTVYKWQWRCPDLWARVEATMAAAMASGQAREGVPPSTLVSPHPTNNT